MNEIQTGSCARKCGCTDSALLILRIMIGAIGLFHGSQKLFGAFGGPGIEGFAGMLSNMGVPYPLVGSWAAALAEFAGGGLILIGLFSRVAAIPFAVNMIVAITKVHWGRFSAQAGGMEYPLSVLAMLLAIMLAGPGRYSVAGAICRGSSKPAGAAPSA